MDIELAKDQLETACKIYCRWYDRAEPDGMDGPMCAYEVVSFVRQALSNLQDESRVCSECNCEWATDTFTERHCPKCLSMRTAEVSDDI